MKAAKREKKIQKQSNQFFNFLMKVVLTTKDFLLGWAAESTGAEVFVGNSLLSICVGCKTQQFN